MENCLEGGGGERGVPMENSSTIQKERLIHPHQITSRRGSEKRPKSGRGMESGLIGLLLNQKGKIYRKTRRCTTKRRLRDERDGARGKEGEKRQTAPEKRASFSKNCNSKLRTEKSNQPPNPFKGDPRGDSGERDVPERALNQ